MSSSNASPHLRARPGTPLDHPPDLTLYCVVLARELPCMRPEMRLRTLTDSALPDCTTLVSTGTIGDQIRRIVYTPHVSYVSAE